MLSTEQAYLRMPIIQMEKEMEETNRWFADKNRLVDQETRIYANSRESGVVVTNCHLLDLAIIFID